MKSSILRKTVLLALLSFVAASADYKVEYLAEYNFLKYYSANKCGSNNDEPCGRFVGSPDNLLFKVNFDSSASHNYSVETAIFLRTPNTSFFYSVVEDSIVKAYGWMGESLYKSKESYAGPTIFYQGSGKNPLISMYNPPSNFKDWMSYVKKDMSYGKGQETCDSCFAYRVIAQNYKYQPNSVSNFESVYTFDDEKALFYDFNVPGYADSMNVVKYVYKGKAYQDNSPTISNVDGNIDSSKIKISYKLHGDKESIKKAVQINEWCEYASLNDDNCTWKKSEKSLYYTQLPYRGSVSPHTGNRIRDTRVVYKVVTHVYDDPTTGKAVYDSVSDTTNLYFWYKFGTYEGYTIDGKIVGKVSGTIGTNRISGVDVASYHENYYRAGSLVILTARPEPGYSFKCWKKYGNNECISEEPQLSFYMMQDTILTPVFEKISNNINSYVSFIKDASKKESSTYTRRLNNGTKSNPFEFTYNRDSLSFTILAQSLDSFYVICKLESNGSSRIKSFGKVSFDKMVNNHYTKTYGLDPKQFFTDNGRSIMYGAGCGLDTTSYNFCMIPVNSRKDTICAGPLYIKWNYVVKFYGPDDKQMSSTEVPYTMNLNKAYSTGEEKIREWLEGKYNTKYITYVFKDWITNGTLGKVEKMNNLVDEFEEKKLYEVSIYPTFDTLYSVYFYNDDKLLGQQSVPKDDIGSFSEVTPDRGGDTNYKYMDSYTCYDRIEGSTSSHRARKGIFKATSPMDCYADFSNLVKFVKVSGKDTTILQKSYVMRDSLVKAPTENIDMDGYTFIGWKADGMQNDSNFAKVRVVKPITYYAQYESVAPASSSSSEKAVSSSSKNVSSSSSASAKSSSSKKTSSSSSSKSKDAIQVSYQAPSFLVTTAARNIQVAGAKVGSLFAVFDMQGRVMSAGRMDAPSMNLTMPRAGTYMLRIAGQIRKVSLR